MSIIKKIILIFLSVLSFNAWAYVCQPSDAYGYDGYNSDTMYDDYYVYNSSIYQKYNIVQNSVGDFQQEYWCLYTNLAEKEAHENSCTHLSSSTRPVCPINIGGLLNDGATNTTIYQDPIDTLTCDIESVCLNIPQTLSVSIGEGGYDANSKNSLGVFLVESNGWVDFDFSGSSYDELGNLINTPYFHKAEVNAKGEAIPSRYDTLNTTIGVRVSNAELLKQLTLTTPSFNSWKLGSDNYGAEAAQPLGTPENFITPMTNTNSPGYAIGAFSPIGLGDQAAEVLVYTTASGLYAEQSGQYTMNIVLNVTAREN